MWDRQDEFATPPFREGQNREINIPIMIVLVGYGHHPHGTSNTLEAQGMSSLNMIRKLTPLSPDHNRLGDVRKFEITPLNTSMTQTAGNSLISGTRGS